MSLQDGTLAVITEDGTIFKTPLANVRAITFPWYYFHGGVKLTVDGRRHRISFIRPNDGFPVSESLLLKAASVVPAMEQLRSEIGILQARAAGKVWQSLLQAK